MQRAWNPIARAVDLLGSLSPPRAPYWRFRAALAAVVFVSAACNIARAQSLEEMAAATREDLNQALAELASVQQAIESERLPLARKVNELEDAVLAKRQEFSRAQREADNQLVSLGVLRKEVERAQSDARFVQALLTEYVTRFETRIHVAEVGRYAEAVSAAKIAPGQTDLPPPDRLGRQMAMLEVSLDRLDSALGGELFEGKALTPAGRLESGTYAVLGPVAFFGSNESASAGVAELRLGSPQPRSLDVGEARALAIRELVRSGEGQMPLDATLGNALKVAESEDSMMGHIVKGGPVMIPILLLGFAAAVIALLKWLQLVRIRMITPMDLQKLLSYVREGDHQAAKGYVNRVTGPVGELLGVALEHASEQKEYLEEVLYEKMLEARPRLERLLPIIALTAATAPLLGLLGTVTGMINTFNMITIFGAGDPRTLSGGISEALITTEFGLIVAIPSLLVHAFISRKVKGVLGSMEQTSVAFINGVPEPATD
jgi:biopolymer transport protein ExbB